MVPYVRKSFAKHYKDGLEFVDDAQLVNPETFFNYDPVNRPIDAKVYKDYPRAYKYALTMTERELKQAVEGMYHNLNTLQSRSGNQLNNTVAA